MSAHLSLPIGILIVTPEAFRIWAICKMRNPPEHAHHAAIEGLPGPTAHHAPLGRHHDDLGVPPVAQVEVVGLSVRGGDGDLPAPRRPHEPDVLPAVGAAAADGE